MILHPLYLISQKIFHARRQAPPPLGANMLDDRQSHSVTLPALQRTFVIFPFNLPGDLALKNSRDFFGEFFGLRLPGNKAIP